MTNETVPCPRCDKTGKAPWKQPGGHVVQITCGLCFGKGKCEARKAAKEPRNDKLKPEGKANA